MQMTLRWYGSKYDTVTLKQIRQIPGVTGVISTLYGTAPGEVWEMDDILALKTEIEAAGLQLAGIESVNIHDAIKIGSPDREQYIENYITTLERLGQAGIHMVCYNFMPVFDWTRTELARMRPDGSTVLAYNQAAVDAIDPAKMFESIAGDMNGTVMPGWEPERMAHVKELFEMYKDVDDEIYCIGGGMIYSEMLAHADKLILTEIDAQADAEVYFPEFDKSLYKKTILSDIEENGIHYQHVEYALK